jgi:anti-anti-sigma factor
MKPAPLTQPPPSVLKMSVELRDGVAILALEGRLDNSLDQDFLRNIEALRREGQHRIVVDCGKLAYVNSRGASAFISVVDDLRESKGDLKLASLKPEAAFVLDRLGISKLIQCFETADAAVRAFATPIEDYQSDGGLDIFIASTDGKVFHASGCKSVRSIRTVRSFVSKKEARAADLRPCRRCC